MTPTSPVSELADQIRGVTYAKEDASSTPRPGTVAILRAGNIEDGTITFDDLVYVPRERVSADQFIRQYDILIATSSGSLEVVGKAAQALANLDVGFGAFCKVLRPRDTIDPRYFAYFFRTARYRRTISRLAAGANINNLRNEHLDNLLVPVPTNGEQHRLATILGKADAVCRNRREALALTEQLLRSVFLETFGDPVANPKGWDKVSLVKLGRITTGNTPSRTVPKYFGSDIEWIKSDNINTPSHFLTRATEGLSKEGRAQGRTAPSGSTLMTCIAGSPDCIGNVALADREVAFNQQINAITPHNGVDHRFLYVLLLLAKRLIQAASTNSMKGMVSKGRLEEVRLPCPPPRMQVEFGETFDRLVGVSRQQEAGSADSERLFAAVLADAFGASARLLDSASKDQRPA